MAMTVHLINPSHLSFGVGVITPRWLFVLGAATPASFGRPCIVDETLESLDLTTVQKPRQRSVDSVVAEIIELRRHGFRFVALADDNFYPVTLADLAMAERQGNSARLQHLRFLRAERFELMARLAELSPDMVVFTQITMEAAEDDSFLDAMRRAHIRGALVGVEAVTPEGLKDVYKNFNQVGEALVQRSASSESAACTSSGRSSSGYPATDRPRSKRQRRSPNAPSSRSLSSSC